MREILKFGFLLGIICTISAGTLSLVYSVVDPLIKENERLEAIKKLRAAGSDAEAFEIMNEAARIARDAYVEEEDKVS